MKKIRKIKTIKSKIILYTSIILTLSLTCCGIFAYLYSSNLLRKQSVKDDTVKLQQTAHQLEYIAQDIIKFAQVIITDSQIQYYSEKSDYQDTFDEYFNRQDAINKLTYYAVMRNYIQSIAMITQQDEVIWSMANDDNYIRSEIKQPWFTDLEKHGLFSGFTMPHVVELRGSKASVISYVTHFNSSKTPQKVIGTLIININQSYFDEVLDIGSQEYDAFVWLLNDERPIYEKGLANQKSEIRYLLTSYSEQITSAKSGDVINISNGYCIVDTLPDYNGRLVSFTSGESIYGRTNYIIYFIIAFIILNIALILVTYLPIIGNIINPVAKLSKAMREVSHGNLDVEMKIFSGDELEQMCDSFNIMVGELKKYINELMKSENEKRKIEHGLLLSQINPHFIYNTLNSVIYIARKNKNYDIVNIVDSFIRILQDAVRIGEDGMYATVGQEIDVVKHYLVIQSYRYPNRFIVNYRIDERLNNYMIPRTIIQPLVENAIIHGVLENDDNGIILVHIYGDEKYIYISVHDNGAGMSEERIRQLTTDSNILDSGTSMRRVGISNIRDRLKFLYGARADLQIESKPGCGTSIIIKIPIEQTNPLLEL
jgi:two-component system sensor histidine kinase YesM